MNDQHMIVTPPDRYWEEGFHVLMVDFDAYLLEQHFAAIANSPIPVIVYVYVPDDNNVPWLFDVAAICDLVLLNCTASTSNDLFKGRLISKPNTWYTGRSDLSEMWRRHTNDPVSRLLTNLDQKIHAKGGE